jgi:rRNA maturation endonuclease Nob1
MTSRFGGRAALIGALSYALPLVVFAASAAGFAPGELWLSKTEANAGDTVKVFTVLYDSSDTSIEGDVDFIVDSDSIQTEHFKLGAGESQMYSADWVATEGAHTFSAQLKNVSGVGALSASASNAVKISVAKSAPSLTSTYINVANSFIASTSPAVANIVQQIASTTEGWRQAGADWLSSALYTDQALASSTSPEPEVLGTSTIAVQNTAQQGGIWTTLKHVALTALLYIFNLRILFYLSLLVVLYVLYKIVRAIFGLRRPHG